MCEAPRWKRGERLYFDFADQRNVEAVVELASENGRSLVLKFEGWAGGYVGMLPLLLDSGEYRDFMGEVAILRKERIA